MIFEILCLCIPIPILGGTKLLTSTKSIKSYNIRCSVNFCGLSRILPICSFRGFLRADNLIGTVTVKLQPLETKCDIHDTYDVS